MTWIAYSVTCALKMKKDKFFIFAFFTTVLLMGVIFSSNIEKLAGFSYGRQLGERIIFEKVNPRLIKKLIRENKLSDKEASFYKSIEQINLP